MYSQRLNYVLNYESYYLCWNAVLILRILSDPCIVPNHGVSAFGTKLVHFL